MNIDTNKYYNYHQKMIGVFYPNCTIKVRRAPSLKGYNTTPYGVFK